MQKKKYNYQTKDRYIKYFSKLIVISVLKEIKSLSEDTILLKLSEDGSVLITIHDDLPQEQKQENITVRLSKCVELLLKIMKNPEKILSQF